MKFKLKDIASTCSRICQFNCVFCKQWPLDSEFVEVEYSPKICHFCRIRVLAKMAFFENWSDSLNSPTFANLVCSDSPDSPTFANLVCSDSPDSQKPSFASITRIWRVWRIQRVQARSFYTYKICYLCLKRPTLSCANICRGLASTRQTRLHLPTCFARTRQTRRHSPTCFTWTRQTRPHLPKAISGKNVTRLDTFAQVICHSRKFGASGHCLVFCLIFYQLRTTAQVCIIVILCNSAKM